MQRADCHHDNPKRPLAWYAPESTNTPMALELGLMLVLILDKPVGAFGLYHCINMDENLSYRAFSNCRLGRSKAIALMNPVLC